MESRKMTGRWGELAAAEYLKDKGWRIVAMNYACRFGEIDVIAENQEYLSFVEVKLRKDASHGEAREFVTPAKQRRIIMAAGKWLMEHPTGKQPRFDVIEIYGARGRLEYLNHIENAFDTT
ncbi:MAG: YraN family protein [Oscillospiraceae bacterium]|nr:YraN family protein [Oscillospiraceae bacterium]